MKEIVLASHNKGKLQELGELLAPLSVRLLSAADFEVPEVDETGLTFVENALLKARAVSAATNRPVIADDSGLSVDFLQGFPGIYTARFATMAREMEGFGDLPPVNSTEANIANIETLLHLLKDAPENQRGASFQCCLVYMRHAQDPTPVICQRSWRGAIATSPQGQGGFGYDPIFYVPDHHCCAAELDKKIKNRLSHRGQAVSQLIEKLKSVL